jgi:hypothetical protein
VRKARLLELATRLEKARCWHQGPSPWGSRLSSKWWDLNPFDVREASILLRELAESAEA